MGAFTIWGGLPLYLKPLARIAPTTIIAHRLVWCFAFVIAWLTAHGQLGAVREALRGRAPRARLLGSATLISANWLVYVWAIGNGHVIDASLGYFINPLVNVLLGVALLGERLNRVQWLAIASAFAGVAWLTALTGRLPWIALTLAFSFSGYGLIRKVVAVDAVIGLAAETALLAPLGVGWLFWQQARGPGAFGPDVFHGVWLFLSGLVTAVPLALFAFGAKRILYSTVGIVQYIGPSLQLALGVLIFGEAFPPARAMGFGLIWAALVIYAGEGLWRMRRTRTLPA